MHKQSQRSNLEIKGWKHATRRRSYRRVYVEGRLKARLLTSSAWKSRGGGGRAQAVLEVLGDRRVRTEKVFPLLEPYDGGVSCFHWGWAEGPLSVVFFERASTFWNPYGCH